MSQLLRVIISISWQGLGAKAKVFFFHFNLLNSSFPFSFLFSVLFYFLPFLQTKRLRLSCPDMIRIHTHSSTVIIIIINIQSNAQQV